MTEQDTIDWLMVWVRGVGLGEHATPRPGQFLHRIAQAAYQAVDTVLPRRITTPELDQQMTDLRIEVARAVMLSLPDPLVERFQEDDPGIRLAVMTAMFLWTLEASDALTLPRGDLSVWRYQLAWAQHQASNLPIAAPAPV